MASWPMKPDTCFLSSGSVTLSRYARTERTKKSSPSGNTDDNEAMTWLPIRSPSTAKCLGRWRSDSSKEMRRVGTVRSVLLVWVTLVTGMLRPWTIPSIDVTVVLATPTPTLQAPLWPLSRRRFGATKEPGPSGLRDHVVLDRAGQDPEG